MEELDEPVIVDTDLITLYYNDDPDKFFYVFEEETFVEKIEAKKQLTKGKNTGIEENALLRIKRILETVGWTDELKSYLEKNMRFFNKDKNKTIFKPNKKYYEILQDPSKRIDRKNLPTQYEQTFKSIIDKPVKITDESSTEEVVAEEVSAEEASAEEVSAEEVEQSESPPLSKKDEEIIKDLEEEINKFLGTKDNDPEDISNLDTLKNELINAMDKYGIGQITRLKADDIFKIIKDSRNGEDISNEQENDVLDFIQNLSDVQNLTEFQRLLDDLVEKLTPVTTTEPTTAQPQTTAEQPPQTTTEESAQAIAETVEPPTEQIDEATKIEEQIKLEREGLRETQAKIAPKFRYHPKAVTTFFESKDLPKWDTVLEANIIKNEYSTEERIEIMNDIIEEYGKKIHVKERKSDTVEELIELMEIQWCFMRNLHLGNRQAQTANVDLNQLNKIKSLSNTLKLQTTQPTQQTTLPTIVGPSEISVQSQEEFDFDKKYDQLQSLRAGEGLPNIKETQKIYKRLQTETGKSLARPDLNNDKVTQFKTAEAEKYDPYSF